VVIVEKSGLERTVYFFETHWELTCVQHEQVIYIRDDCVVYRRSILYTT
jgi:hypothetical protein